MINRQFLKRSIIVLLIAFSFKGYADKPKVNGYYISNNGDTNFVTFLIPKKIIGKELQPVSLQTNLKYLDEKKSSVRLNPNENMEFCFSYMDKTYRYQAVPMSWNPMFPDSRIFLRVEKDGPCGLYTYCERERNMGFMIESPVFHIKGKTAYLTPKILLGNALLLGVTQPRLADYFSECPLLAEQIKHKTFEDNHKIVEFYNSQCGDSDIPH